MRFRLLAALATAGLAVAAAPAATDLANPGPAFFTSEGVEHVANFPEHAGTSGGRLVGDHFYMFDPRGVYIYDVTDPESPVQTGSVALFQQTTGAVLGQEDVDTNGEILLADGALEPVGTSQLHVIDVSDKTNPQIIGSVAATSHTWTCVLDCTYAYGRDSGYIIDLTDPANPEIADVSWIAESGVRNGYTHDLTEIAPGILMSSGQPSFYLDARDPLAPKLRTELETRFSTLGYHGNQWAKEGTDRFLVMGTEIGQNTTGGDCSQSEGVLHVYDTTEVQKADVAEAAGKPRPEAEFELLGEYKLPGPGVYADGSAPYNILYCTHWFDLHPAFDDGGLVAMGNYEQGVKFLDVTSEGQIEELGWFQPVGGSTSAAYWITDEIVYTADYRRGMDILRFTP